MLGDVVDSVHNPALVLGIADGRGGIQNEIKEVDEED